MSIISSCNGKNCEIKENCKRFLKFKTLNNKFPIMIQRLYKDGKCKFYRKKELNYVDKNK